MAMTLRWTNAADSDFILLTRELDAYLQGCNGENQADYSPYNVMSAQTEAIVVYDGDIPVACGALRQYEEHTAEIKRMFVKLSHRRSGLARIILSALEERAKALGCTRLILETSPSFSSAVALYQSFGFHEIEPFGPYQTLCTLCMGKDILSL